MFHKLNLNHLHVYLDAEMDENGRNSLRFDGSFNFKWRYATIEEIEEYDRIDKPYDVTTLEIKPIIEENYDYLTKLLNKLEIK